MPPDNTPIQHQPATPTIRVLQLNTHRSHHVTTALFNDPLTRSFHLLLIREPPTRWLASKPVSDPNWHTIEPVTDSTYTPDDNSQIRSVIYVNNTLPSFSFSPLLTNSLNIAGVKLALPYPHPPIHFISAYLPPGQAHTMQPLQPILASINRRLVVLGMDSKLHHPIWNPANYTHTHREANDLLQLTAQHGLLLRSEPGVPTHFSNNRQGSETTIDLQWHSPACYDWATVCSTDTTLTHSHFSDHAAIITEISIPDPDLTIAVQRCRPNWSKADWKAYADTLTPLLSELQDTPLTSLKRQQDVDQYAAQLEAAIKQAQHGAVPDLKIRQSSRRWWNAEVLNPLKGHALNLRRVAQWSKAPHDKIEYRKAQAKFQREVKLAKRQHWHRYLENLTDTDLFTAAKYCDGPTQSCILPPLRMPDGTLTDHPALQAELLFQATGGPTIACDTSDITQPRHSTALPTLFTPEDLAARISRLKLGKAPGQDGITA